MLTPWLALYVPGMCHMYLRDWDAAKESLDQALALNRHQQTYTVLGRWGLVLQKAPSKYDPNVRNLGEGPY